MTASRNAGTSYLVSLMNNEENLKPGAGNGMVTPSLQVHKVIIFSASSLAQL